MRLLLCLLLGALTYAQDAVPPPDPVKWRLADTPKSVRPGQVFTVTVTAKIDEGWHLYSFKKHEDGPVPLTITAPTPQSFRLLGTIDAPVGLTAFEESFGREVEFYLGEVEIGVPVQALREAKPGKWKLVLEARYQVSDNNRCLPPKTVKLESEIQVQE